MPTHTEFNYGIVSAEYSAELQLQVLGVDAKSLLEPILDVGCGSRANLVRELRRLGKEATGIDNIVEEGLWVHKADWFSFELVSCTWGTVVSHQGFTNRFLQQHLSPGGEAVHYARRYMEILWSLKPGGMFVYAPGLPFIEDLLPPERFRVTRRSVAGLVPDEDMEERLAKALGRSPIYACRVKRVVG